MKSKYLETFTGIWYCCDIQEAFPFSTNLLVLYFNKIEKIKMNTQTKKKETFFFFFFLPQLAWGHWLKTIGKANAFPMGTSACGDITGETEGVGGNNWVLLFFFFFFWLVLITSGLWRHQDFPDMCNLCGIWKVETGNDWRNSRNLYYGEAWSWAWINDRKPMCGEDQLFYCLLPRSVL